MATAKTKQAETPVNNLGDVTEQKVLAVAGIPDFQPLDELPADAKVLAERHPSAKGFSEVGGMTVLHF